MLSITTDYATDKGCPEPYLRAIAEAGFTHVHWCHHWNTDFIYSETEIDQIGFWLKDYGLALNDIHASSGQEKSWGSMREYERAAGVELVKNRMEMAAALDGDVIIMHFPAEPKESSQLRGYWDRMRRNLDELASASRSLGVRLALENLNQESFPTLTKVFDTYGPDFIGLCFDSGHANIGAKDGAEQLNRLKHRLIAIHLHDNDGTADQHRLPFSGTVDWPALAPVLANSAYAKPTSLEAVIKNTGITDEREFLDKAFETGSRFAAMIQACRIGHPFQNQRDASERT